MRDEDKAKYHSVKMRAKGITGWGASIEIDGEPMKGVVDVNAHISVDGMHRVIVEFFVKDLKIETGKFAEAPVEDDKPLPTPVPTGGMSRE